MGEILFERAVRVTVGNSDGATALQATGLRVRFHVKRTLRFEPSTAEIEIFNVSRAHRERMKARWAPVIVEAGYGTALGRVFSGQARTIDHVRDQTDWITKIQCGDGEAAFRYAMVTDSWGPGTSTLQVAKALAASLGSLTAESEASLQGALTDEFARGYAARGSAARELDRLLSARGLEWSVQDGKVQVLPLGKPTQRRAVLLTPKTGLVGSPEHGTPSPQFATDHSHTLRMRSLLQPTLVPGGLVQLQSQAATGLFRVLSVEHSGDTQGGDWYSSVEANPTS